jgi:hypothetical protein
MKLKTKKVVTRSVVSKDFNKWQKRTKVLLEIAKTHVDNLNRQLTCQRVLFPD